MPKDNTTYDLFLSSNGEITISDWEQIIHSLITYGDTIWLPSGFETTPFLDSDTSDEINWKLQELIEMDLVRLWELEGLGRSTNTHSSRVGLVVPIEEQEELTGTISDALSIDHQSVTQNINPKDIDTASRLIEYRQELWNIGIASFCDANGIVYRKNANHEGARPSANNYDDLCRNYTELLFKEFKVPSLRGLEIGEIAELRNHAHYLRNRLDELIAQSPDSEFTEEDLLRDIRPLYKEYLNVVEGVLREQVRLFNADFVLSSVGLLIPIVSVVPIVRRLATWFDQRKQHRFALKWS